MLEIGIKILLTELEVLFADQIKKERETQQLERKKEEKEKKKKNRGKKGRKWKEQK